MEVVYISHSERSDDVSEELLPISTLSFYRTTSRAHVLFTHWYTACHSTGLPSAVCMLGDDSSRAALKQDRPKIWCKRWRCQDDMNVAFAPKVSLANEQDKKGVTVMSCKTAPAYVQFSTF